MNNFKIKVSKDELIFIREALFNYYEELNERFCEEEDEKFDPIPVWFKPPNKSEIETKPKKPHWTQTPEGKKIMANRKPRGGKKNV
jgi:hypothetical protein